MPIFAGGKTRFQPVYVWDLAKGVIKADQQFEKFKGELFEIGGPKIYTYKQLIRLTLTQAGLRRPIISLPWSIGYLQGLLMEQLPINLFTITRDQIKLLRKDNVVDGNGVLTLHDLGIDPTPPEKILYTYLRKHEINANTQNKRTHRPIDRSIEQEIEEVNQIIKDMPKDALNKEAEYRKLHEEIDKKRSNEINNRQTVVTSSIVVPSTSAARRNSRQDTLPKRRASNDMTRQNYEESKRPRLDMNNSELKKRGQRMFGVLLGTLTKFKSESQNKSEARDCWTTQKKNLANFLSTATEPSLYYLPARLSQVMLETIAEQKRQLALASQDDDDSADINVANIASADNNNKNNDDDDEDMNNDEEANLATNSTLNEYERKRLENIRRNQEILNKLSIPEFVNSLKPAKRLKPDYNKSKKAVQPKIPTQPTRKSLRIRGKEPVDQENKKSNVKEGNDVDNGTNKRKTRSSLYPMVEEKRVVRRGDLELDIIRSDETSKDDTNKFIAILSDLSKYKEDFKVEIVKNVDINYEKIPGGTGGLESVRSTYRSFSIKTYWPSVKVTYERIYAMAIHPAIDKILVAAGDRKGTLGFWDVNDKEVIKNEPHPRTYSFNAHSGPISSIKYSPVDSNCLYSCSYDGTIRYLDLNNPKFVEAFVSNSTYTINDFDMDMYAKRIIFVTNNGWIGAKDVRESLSKFVEFDIHDGSKVNCVSLNPTDPNLLVTASLDKTVRLWDIRKMKSSGPAELQIFNFGNSMTSAKWSPDGSQVVSTGFDSLIRIFDLNEEKHLEERIRIPHNNFTGKWVTMFRSIWNPNAQLHPHFVVAVNAFHPKINLIAGGNSSGKVVVWG
ncbi:5370_t:CDS:10 [Entrophospora sp. SA101]|nr:5370_t:CDS:10 [Entrophospora sp. SA101]